MENKSHFWINRKLLKMPFFAYPEATWYVSSKVLSCVQHIFSQFIWWFEYPNTSYWYYLVPSDIWYHLLSSLSPGLFVVPVNYGTLTPNL